MVKKVKKSPFAYNNRYAEGYQTLQGIRERNALTSAAIQEPYNTGSFSTVSTENAPELSFYEKYGNYPEIDEDAQVLQKEPEENETKFYEYPLKWGSDLVKSIGQQWDDAMNASPADVWRLTLTKGFESHLSSLQQRQMTNRWNLEDLDLAQQYIDQINTVESLQKKVDAAKNITNNPAYLENLNNQLSSETQKLINIEANIKDKWRDSDAFLRTFTDLGKMAELNTSLSGLRMGLEMAKPTRREEAHGFWDSTKAVVGDVLSAGSNLFSNLGYTIGDVLHLTDDNAATARNVIRNSDKNNQFINQFFHSYENASDKEGYKKQILQSISDLRKQYQRKDDELTASALSTINTLRNGNWAFDPRKIDPIYKKKQEQNDGSVFDILNPLRLPYAIPEMGSSYSDLETMAAMLASEQAFAYAGELFNPGKKVKAAMAVGAIMTNLGIAKKLREEETGSEVSDAYAQRLVNELYSNRNIDAQKVLDSIDTFAKSLGGLDFNPDELDLQKKMSLALAYNLKTGDKAFDDFAKSARTGLTKVYNENMSLSTGDYLAAIPFMNYTRSVVKDIASKPFSKLMSKAASTKVGGYLSNVSSKVADKYNRVTQAMTDKAVTKMFGSGVESTVNKLRALHAFRWVKDKAKKGMFTGFVEGTEEGQQQLLQSRYQRGEYDEYDSPTYDSTVFNPTTLFDIPSSLKDLDLGTAALACYLGINFGDPDNGDEELRKAMTTGATTGMLFTALHAMGMSNLSRAHMDPSNLRALYRQFQNDAVIGKLVGDNYGAAQDDAHIAQFFRSMDKHGLNRMQLEQSLEDFKRFKGGLVKDEYIDRDIDLLNNTYFAYNNNATNGILNNLNIRRGSDDHLKVVQNAVRAFMDYDTLSSKIKDQQKKADELSDKINSIVDFYLDEKEDEGTVPEDIKNLRTSLKPIIDELRKQYAQYQLEAKANNDVKRQELLGDEKFVKKVKNEFGYDDKINGAENDEAKAKVNEEYQKKLNEAVDSQLSVADEKSYVNSSLNMVFEARKAQQIKKVLDLFDNRQKIAKEIEKEFGIDLNADRLANVIDNMREVYQNITSENNKKLKSENDRRTELNKLIEKLNSQIDRENSKNKGKKGYVPKKKHNLYKKATIQSIVKDLDPLLGDTQEYNSIIKSIFINNAVLKLYQPYMEAYSTGQANPYDVKHQARPLRWSELSKDQQDEYANKLRKQYEEEGKDTSTLTQKRLASLYNYEQSIARVELAKLTSRQKKLIDDFNRKDEQDRTVSEELQFSREIGDIRSKAAQQLIEDDLNKKRERQRIAHREFLQNGGLTTDDIDNAESGDAQSSENVREAASNEKPTAQEEDQPASQQPDVTDNVTTPQPSAAEEQPQQSKSGNPFEDFVGQHAVDGGLLDTEASPEDLVEEEMGQRKPKRKAKDEKPKTKEDIVDDIEKPGTAEAAKVDTPSSEEVQQAIAGETKQSHEESKPKPQQNQLIDTSKGEFSIDEFLAASTINALVNGSFDIKNLFSNLKNTQITVGDYTLNKYEDVIDSQYTRVEVLDKNKKRVKIKIPSYAKLHEPLHDGEYICSVSFNKDNNTYYAETSEYREIAIDINQDEYNKQLGYTNNDEKQPGSKKETSTDRDVNIDATITADQLKSGKIKLDSISNLEEGGYNLSDGSVLRVSKSPEGTMVGITKYVDKPDGSADEEIVQIQIPYTHTTTEELEEGEQIVGLMVGTDGINKVATTKGRVIDLVQRGVSVDPNQNMSNPEVGEKNIDKNTGNEKDTTNSTAEEDDDISDAAETSTEPESNAPIEAPINTNEQLTESNEGLQEMDVDDDGNVLVNGRLLTEEEARQLENINFQMDLRDLESAEVSGGLILNDEDPDYHVVQNSDQVKRDFLSQTFFYNRKATQPPYLRVNRKDVHLKYPIQTGAQLAQKLSQKGWFEKTTKFYVVSGNTTTNIDELTVSMVIYDEEEEKSYVTYMRTPSGEDLIKLTNSLLFIGVNKETFGQNLQDSREYYFGIAFGPGVREMTPAQLSTRAKLWYEGTADLDGKRGNDQDADKMISRSTKDQIEDNARKRSSNGKSKVLTRQEIRDNIKQLKQRRQEIINAYCVKNANGEYVLSTEVNDFVKPKNPRISNGRLQSRKRNSDNSPAFHVLFGKENNLGISPNPEELQEQINSGDVEFGVGRGMFGKPAFSITSLDGKVPYNGKGLAGKLYLIYKTATSKIPIMLREQRFDQMPNGKLELSIDPSDGKIIRSAENRPSDAEILLYLLTGKLNEQYYPNQDAKTGQAFCDLFINNGEHTTNTTKNTPSALKKFSYYAKKQISWDYNEGKGKYELTIVLPDDNGNLRQRFIAQDQLFANTQESIELRKQVVQAIADNMHFNTDLEQLTQGLNDKVIRALREHFNRTGDNSFSFCGSNILAFKKSDLFNEDGSAKKISVLTWLISTGKLMSDIAQQPLADPFVFATGVEVSQQKQVIKTERTKSKGKSVDGKPLPSGVVSTAAAKENERKKFEAFPAGKTKRVAARFGRYAEQVEKGILFASDAETRASLLDKFNNNGHGGLRDQLIVDLSDDAMSNPALVKPEIEQKIQEYVKATGFNLTEIKFDDRFKHLTNRLIQTKIPYVLVSNDGYIYVTLKDIKGDVGQTVQSLVGQGQNRQVSSQMVTGVFSTEKGNGKFNENKARKWLANVLGIEDSKIIVLNGILRSIYNEEVYGVMQQSIDSLNEPVFLFSNEAGQGVEFHEAWHYVNLLLHNNVTRSAIYRAYCKKHPELKDKSYKEIEELLAEEYRKYAIMRNDNSIGNVIKRWFNNVYDFCTLNYRNKELIRSIFNNINTGKYKNNLIDSESLSEFKRRYAGQVNQSKYQIPTVDDKIIDNFNYVDTYHKFYMVAEALANKMIDYYAINRIEDIKGLKEDSFKEFLDDLKQTSDDDIRGIVDDVYKNPSAFYSIVQQAFSQYGVSIKIKKLKQLKQDKQNSTVTENTEEEKSEKVDVGERADNSWDVFQFGESKKDNVANRAKLFLTHIQRARLEVDPDNLNEKVLVYETDPLLNSPVYVPFGEAWTKITSEMWDIESYADMDKDGNYISTSFRGKVKQRAKYEWFYRVLDKKLDELDGDKFGNEPDIEMQNQIYSTVKSQQAQMAQIWLEDSKRKFTVNSEFEDVIGDDAYLSNNASNDDIDDVDRNWNIIDDNGLRAKRSLPRQWSNTAMLSGLVTYDKGKTVVNTNFTKYIKKQFTDIKNILSRKYTSIQQVQDAYDEASDKFIDLLNYMCIPCDNDVFDYIIDSQIKQNEIGDVKSRFNALNKFIKDNTSGSIGDIISSLPESGVHTELPIGKSKTKDISKIYMGFKTSSQICLLAEAYNSIHPASQDFSVKGPDGSMHYPISQNNHMSDAVRQLNIDKKAVEQKMLSPYAKNSLLFKIAKDLDPNAGKDEQFRLNAFIGMKDTRVQKGQDYFGINNIEDFLSKMEMTFNNMLTLPTMADKKTWYAIKQKLLQLPHDLITYDIEAGDGSMKIRRFSNNTLDIFVGYFMDELNAVKQYYSRDNIAYLQKHKNSLRDNFHGKFNKFKNGDKTEERLEFGGNGGLFRYMYGIDMSHGCNLNQYLEALYNQQRKMEEHPTRYDGVGLLEEDGEPLDGFELIRKALSDIESKFSDRETVRTAINDNILMPRVDDTISALTADTDYKLGWMDNGQFHPDAIPSHILNWYGRQFSKHNVSVSHRAYSDNRMINNLGLSAIANHTAATMISIIELEKVFSGDPAFYKWKYQKSKQRVHIFEHGMSFFSNVKILKEKDSDKIKRLGALLSPGANIRTDYGEDITNNPKYKGLKGDKYTVLNINDFQSKSTYLEDARQNFARQSAIEYLRLAVKYKKAPWLQAYLGKNGYKNAEELFTEMYKDFSVYDKFMDINNHAESFKQPVQVFINAIDSVANMSASPYSKITVSDAQVIIRPALYRKIRIGMGRWSFEEDETGYSDEKAYQILEKDGSWMADDEKTAIVSKLQLFPLKMSYFQNDSTILSSGEDFENRINLPIYDKMAIFPMFKYMTRSSVGRALYDRMNKPKNEIDMVTFESAVKVGDNQNRFTPYKNLEDDPGKDFNFKDLSLDSDKHLDENNSVVENKNSKTLAISVQSLNGLRWQLNTDAHEAEARAIGSQMFKIAFSNILDNADYCMNKKDKDGKPRKLRKGRDIKYDIMSCINALTYIGADNIKDEFDINNNVANPKKVEDYVRRITRSNGLGYPSQDIIDNYGIAASLPSRKVFEQGASSLVNGEVVKINTKGGSAVQQSIFGLTGFNREHIAGQDEAQGFYDQDGYHVLNGGKEIKWIAKNNTMEVMLSINFFRAILPKELRNASYKARRQWLIDHDIIHGIKSNSYDKFSEKDEKQNEINKALKHRVEYEVSIQDNVLKLTDAARTFLDNAHEKDYDIKDGQLYKYEDLINNDWSKYEGYTEDIQKEIDRLLTWNNLNKKSKYEEAKPIKTQSNPMPIGIGYRIPTQGMSSMFGFICADVLPEQSGDLIIVPREFTAQTGSDFDVDKLFIAMKSYTNGVYDDFTKEERKKIIDIYNDKSIKNKANAIAQFLRTVNPNAIQNRLLDDYLDIITDIRNFDNARASIDTITAKIQTELLPLLQTQSTTYRDSGYELTPTYQLRRKMEFTTGKSGIGPFALNITNMALTQFVKLTMRYGDGVRAFNFGDLYEITGQDGLRIADWLSAMVNAHVDVAKDPYIFDMNINSATYKFVNFLLRAGKGLSTFTFIGQPAIKDLANLIQNANGMYGNNIKSRQLGKKKVYEDAWTKTFKKYSDMLKAKINTGDFSEFSSDEEKTKYVTMAIELYKHSALSDVDKNSMNVTEEFEKIFNLSYAKSILQNPYSIKGLCHQILALQAYLRIEPYANELSNLVKVSRIDTEKFGNNIADQINFKNTYDNFKYGRHSVQWYISEDGKRMTKKELDKFAETHGRSYALRKYFGSTFLDSKLHLATDLTRIILRNQLCTATDVFEELFTSFFGAVNGVSELSVEKPTPDGNFTIDTQLGYEDVYKQESVAAVSEAIDNIMRYRILRNAKVAKPDSKNSKEFDYTTYAGPIDFTCGNNPEAVSENMKRLLFGDPKGKDKYSQNDLFKNLAQVIDMLEHTDAYKNPAVTKFAIESGLLDIDGKLNNEFLKFLRPQTASDKFPIGRMLLAKSSFGITGQEESILISAFNDLLENRNPTIRRLARDLAFYAYYSAYDTNGVNSFFKFVPAFYRQQYDRALKHALMQNKSNLYSIIKNTTENNPAGDIKGSVLDDFIDKICRNYWYDDNIVPVCKPYASQQSLNSGANIVTLSPVPVLFKPFGQMAPQTNLVNGVIISSVNGDSPFVKVQKGRQWYLYKLIGHITRKSGKSTKPYGVYVVINKRGIHEGGIHQYEFNTSADEYSIFKQNRLPDQLSLLSVNGKPGMLDAIDSYIRSQVDTAPVNNNGEKTIQYTFTPMENTYISFKGYYATGTTQKVSDSIVSSNDGKVRFIYTTNVESELNKCDIVLNLTNKAEIDKQLDDIRNTYKGQNAADDTSRPLTIAVKGSLQSVQISDSAVNNYIKILADQYKQAKLKEDPNINTELMQQLIDSYRDGLNKEEIKTLLSQARINNSVQTVLDTVLSIVPVRSIYSTGEAGVAEAAIKYAQQHSTEFISSHYITNENGKSTYVSNNSGQPAYVILNKKDVNKQGKNKLIEFVNKFNITDDLYTLSNEEYENLKTIQDVIETTEEELNSDITQQQAIQEETQKKIDTPAIQQDDLATSNEVTQNVTSLSGLFTGGIGGIVEESEQKENSEDKDDSEHKNNYSEGC